MVALVMAAMLVATAAPAFAIGCGVPMPEDVGTLCAVGGGDADTTGTQTQLVNERSGFTVLHTTGNIHGSGDPSITNCVFEERPQEGECDAK